MATSAGRKRKETTRSRKLTFSGDLTLPHIGKLAARLRQALSTAERLTLEVQAGGEVDLSFLQLLCAAHRSARESGRTIRLGSAAGQSLHALLLEAGMIRQGCGHRDVSSCFWTQHQGRPKMKSKRESADRSRDPGGRKEEPRES